MIKRFTQHGFALIGIVIVVATIALIGFVAFRFLNAQNNSEVATNQPTTTQVTNIKTAADIDTVTAELDNAELDSIDADLNSEFAF